MIKLWRIYFVAYFAIGFLANTMHDYYTPPFLKTLIPFFFFLAFTEYMYKEKRKKIFLNTALITFMVANIVLIFFQKINYSVDQFGIYEYDLNRAGGVHGDANNAALMCLITYVLIRNNWKPKTNFQKLIRLLAYGITFYAFFLAFSKTGMVILILILVIQQLKDFNLKRFFILFFILPLMLILGIQYGLNSNLLNDSQRDRLENVINILTLNVDKVDSSSRDELLLNMLDYVFENPILGNGIYFSNEIRGHNTYFGIWADSGILTFLIFLAIPISYFRKAMQIESNKRVFALSLMSVLFIYMMTLQTVINQPYLMGIFVFLCYLVSPKERREQLTT
nr:O-antigen ligase family protein [uncultured Allomuricauda sp.]